jgi:hypothetical protein
MNRLQRQLNMTCTMEVIIYTNVMGVYGNAEMDGYLTTSQQQLQDAEVYLHRN